MQENMTKRKREKRQKRQKRQIAQSEEKFKIMGGQEIVKEYFSPSTSLQNIAENIPLQGVLFFCCHKCHIHWDKVLTDRKIKHYTNIYLDLLPKTERKREKRHVVFGKTTRCFMENDTLFLVKQAVV